MSDDELLSPGSAPANDNLRADLLKRTTNRLRFGRRMRATKVVALGMFCFASGLATTLLRPMPEPTVVYIVREQPVPESKSDEPETSPPLPASAAQLELEAEKTVAKTDSARRFREAGDKYLRELADYRSALRCYRNFLDEAEPGDRAVAPEDTWLLTSLKRAREQENEK